MNWYKKASVKREFRWTCDLCKKEVSQREYGLPKGWEWYGGTVKEPEVKHKCDSCVSGPPEDEWLAKEIDKLK